MRNKTKQGHSMSKQVEIPDFVMEMSKQINEQDNRCTSDPIYQVRCKRFLITKEGYNEHHIEVIDTDEGRVIYRSDIDEDFRCIFDHLLENHSDHLCEWLEFETGNEYTVEEDSKESEIEGAYQAFSDNYDGEIFDFPYGMERMAVQEVEEVVSTHFALADAEAFIKRKQHDYPPLYTYAASMCFSWNMIELRKWIMSLTAGNS